MPRPQSNASRKRVRWVPGLIFGVPLTDGSFGVGQTSELMWPNVGYCALFSARIAAVGDPVPHLGRRDVVALLAVERHGLASGHWPVLATAPALFGKGEFANEQFREAGYVGAKMLDYGLAEALLSAYHGLAPWNDWKDPNYLDTLLAPNVTRPTTARVLDDAELAKYRATTTPGSSPRAV